MATITAGRQVLTIQGKDIERVEVDSGVTVKESWACSFNTDGEIVANNVTAANIYCGLAQGVDVEGDGSVDEQAEIVGGCHQISVSDWTISGTGATKYMYPLYLTAQSVVPTFTRPTAYGQVAGYQDMQYQFVQLSEAERFVLNCAGGDKRRHFFGMMAGTDLTTATNFKHSNWGRKYVTKVGVYNNIALAPTNSTTQFTVYKGTAIGTATSVGTFQITGTAGVIVNGENAYTTAFELNDGQNIYVVPTDMGSVPITAGAVSLFIEEVGIGGN